LFVTASGARLGGPVVADDLTPDNAIAGAFAPTLTANQLRYLPAWPYETIHPVTKRARGNGFAEVRKAMASTRADFLYWDLAPNHDATTKTVGEIISTIDKLRTSLRALLDVDPLSLDESASAKERLLSRILREVDLYLPDQGLPLGENARQFILKQFGALIELRGPFDGTQQRFSHNE
jgi:hypothetical protein